MNKVERQALQKTMKRLVRWNHVDLNVQTSGQVLNCVHTAAANGKTYWQKFMSWKIPVGMTAKLIFHTPVRFKQYSATGEEQARATKMMLGLQKVGKAMPMEITQLIYGQWYDISWADQLNTKSRDSLIVDLGGCYEALFWEGEQIQLLVKNSSIDIPEAPHASTLIAYPIQVQTNADLARQLNEIRIAAMKARGIDVAD